MLKLYNTLTREKEEFKPLKDKEVSIYTCGPTVYNHAHIGNLRAYVFADVLNRTLRFLDYKPKWILNITDVDDKTIRDSKKEGIPLKEFTGQYENLFYKDIEKLNIKKESFLANPRATETIPEMQEIIKKLLSKNLAYISDGSVYFSIKKYVEDGNKYGELLNIDMEGFKDGARVDVDEYEKEDLKDFVLWKGKKEEDEPSWPFEIAGENIEGRPGWHIECSAMSQKYLGDTFDIHTGGVDLVFPHHEDEIAQSIGANGKGTFAKYFLHNEHLLVEGKKMSKSLHNFYTLEDIEKMVKNPLALRYLILKSHYRNKLDFSKEALLEAQSTLNNINQFLGRIKQINRVESSFPKDIPRWLMQVEQAIGDDLNTPVALAVLHSMITEINTNFDKISKQQAEEIYEVIQKIDSILGLGLQYTNVRLSPDEEELLAKREEARNNKDFETSDRLRDELLEMGIELEDTAEGTRWRKI